jgi:hypothetical protein
MGSRRETAIRFGAAAALAALFAAGTALGMALERNRPVADSASELPQPLRRDRPEPPNAWTIDRLDLTQDQRARVDSVVRHYGARMSALQKEYRPRYRSIVDSTHGALKVLLSPEQEVRYDSLTAAAERWRARNRSDRAVP